MRTGKNENEKSGAKEPSGFLYIVKREINDEEACAMDFCEELESLAGVHEVRGCEVERMGNAMIYAGLCALNERSRNRAEAAMKTVEIIESWRTFPDEG